MKKIMTIILAAVPGWAFAQAVNISPSTTLPRPNPYHEVEQRDGKGHKSMITPTSEQKKQQAAPVTIFKGAVQDHKIVGGTTYDPLTGGITTGGVTTGATDNGDGTATGGTTTGGTTKYSAWVFNTNFTIPLVRVNFLVNKPQNPTNSAASVSFFNSVGAGFNISLGDLMETHDGTGAISSLKFYNTVGFFAGAIFSANTSTGSSSSTTSSSTTPAQAGTTSGSSSSTNTVSQSSTVFAAIAGLSFLNLQVGIGYEFGSLTPGQRRGFLALSYAIPVSTLVDGGYKILGINKLKVPQ